jgi:hypothetical protein
MDAAQIRAGLSLIADRYQTIAVLFHVAMVVLVAAVWRGWRPSSRTVARMLVAPLVSVALFAALTGNPFTTVLFLALAFTIGAVTRRMVDVAPQLGARWSRPLAVAMIVFGWSYPHFLAGKSALAYLYASATGLLPCPTLALLIGITLLLGGLGSRVWSGVLTGAGLFYGALGAFGLGVLIDLVLVGGAGGLLVTTLLASAGQRQAVALPRDRSRWPHHCGQA